jgi:hypothetical protein
MVAAGAVSGTVTTGVGASPATSVVALTSDWQVAYRGTVAGDGTYRLGGLRPGSYRIAFDHSNPNHEGPDATWVTTNQVRYWRSGYLTGVPETGWSTATLRTVTANTDSSGTNAQVQAGGSVNGALTCRNGGAPVDGTSTYGISLVTGSEPYIDRFTHVDAGLGWASSGHSTGVDYIFMVYGCEMPIFLGNTLNPWKADYVPGAESGLDVGGLDLRTALLFKDVSAFTAFAADMQWLVLRGIATGYSDDTFRPVTSVRRDAMAAFLYRMAGEPAYTPPSVSPFADVTPSTQFYKEMSWLYSTGISTGWVSGGKRYYKPGLAVARDAMAAFIYRFAGSPTYSETFHFDDVTDQTLFHKEMDWMFDAGISTGWVENGQTLYKPLNSVNRDAMAAFLHRLDKWTAAAGAAPAAASAKSGSAPSLLSQSVGDAGSRSGNAGSGLLDPSILAHLKSMR